VGNMSIDGQYQTTGSRFRTNCMHIRSAAFTCEYNAETGMFTIITSGYGHGVGMSQYGAHFYAKYDGWDYKTILRHYYQGIEFNESGW
ncbi:MAG: stage II sporulation protein D, partial [Ruminococcaceae bacterium]|nr:stage II sporulation protein D [Oscillospiraceae bacterium]